MSHITKIEVKRSEQWLREQQLSRSENLPETISVDVVVDKLSGQSRKILLGMGRGQYPDEISMWSFNSEYQWSGNGHGYGWFAPQIDSDNPTVDEIDQAICVQDGILTAKSAAVAEKRARAEWERAAKEEKDDAVEKQIEAARELLSGELLQLQQSIDDLKSDRNLLSNFLSHVPQDALWGTLKAIVHSDANVDDLREEIEIASSSTIFVDEDEDDADVDDLREEIEIASSLTIFVDEDEDEDEDEESAGW